MSTRLEHVNLNVPDAKASADRLSRLFGWHVRWQGPASDGYTVHIGTENDYLALYTPHESTTQPLARYQSRTGLNHIGIVVENFEDIRHKVEAEGYKPYNFGDYEPGRRFYFTDDTDNIEYEVVKYD